MQGASRGVPLTAARIPLAAHGLHVRLGRGAAARRAVDGASVDIVPGWTAVVGPNGAGKSTLLRLLAGLQPPDAGEVLLNGTPLADWPPRARARHVAWMPQQDADGGELSVHDVVRLGRLPHIGLFGAPTAEDERLVQCAMERCGIAVSATRRLDALSGGERQRALLARVLAVGAPVVLLDEPTAHLDPSHQVALADTLHALARSGTAVVSVLHDLTLALQADRLIVMRGGRIVHEGERADPRLHRAIVEAFDGAVRVQPFGDGWSAWPAYRD